MELSKDRLPVFAIGVPVYNGASYIEEALLSCINQDYAGKFYIIVSDDCSTDGTWKLVNTLVKKYSKYNWIIEKHKERSSLCGNQQNTIRMCPKDVDIYVKMDADDISVSHRLTTLAQYFLENPDVDLIGSNVDYLIDGEIQKCSNASGYIARMDANTPQTLAKQWGCTLAFTRQLWEAYPPANGFVENDDLVLSLRARLFGVMLNIPDHLLYYRLHANQMTNTENNKKINRWNTFLQFRRDLNFAYKHGYITISQFIKLALPIYKYGMAAMLNKSKMWRWMRDKRQLRNAGK